MTQSHDPHNARPRRLRWPWVAVSVVALGVLMAFVAGAAAPHLGGIGQVQETFSPRPPVDADDGGGNLDGRTVTITDTDEPAVARLNADLRAALREATDAAAADGIEMRITSGWRGAAYQQRLLDDAVERYGSYDEARRWVQTPEGSSHVTGDAVDVGPTDAAYWMAQHGHRFGLCQTYANEIWHYELRVSPGEQCPPPAADSST